MVTEKEMKQFVTEDIEVNGKVAYQVSAAEMKRFDNVKWELAELVSNRKKKFEKENNLKATVAYGVLEDVCQISAVTIKKSITGTIKITRSFLYKFTVGLHMSLEEANEYFELCGGPLNEQWGEDYICIKALEHGDDISFFIKQYEEFAELKIALRNRNDKK